MDVLVTYDINTTTREGEVRLARVAQVCERYGVRVQYSVFECRLSEASLLKLHIELEGVIEPALTPCTCTDSPSPCRTREP